MNIINSTKLTTKKGEEIEIYLEHDTMKFTTYPTRIMNNKNDIIGCYADYTGIPHLVHRKSLYGDYIIKVFIDSREYNPTGWK